MTLGARIGALNTVQWASAAARRIPMEVARSGGLVDVSTIAARRLAGDLAPHFVDVSTTAALVGSWATTAARVARVARAAESRGSRRGER